MPSKESSPVQSNPVEEHYKTTKGYRVKKKKSSLEKRLTEEEEARLYASFTYANHKGYARRNKAIIQFLLNTGLRVNELASLVLSDVLNLNGTIKEVLDVRPETAKRKKPRQVPLNTKAREAAKELIECRAADPVFTDHLVVRPDGKPLSKRSIQDAVTLSCLKAGISRLVGPHALRHTMLSKLYKTTKNIKVVQTIAGHASAQLTINLYTHATMGDLQEAVESLD